MCEKAEVSIVVPIYNMQQYLEKCISSLINQSYRNIEIILVNDGSNDGSAEICRKYKSKDERVIYIEQENQGVSVARNQGLSQAVGEWISFIDGDDWAAPDMIEALLNVGEQYDIIIGDTYVVKNDKIVYTSFYESKVSEEDKHRQIYLIGNALGCAAYGSTRLCNIGVPWARLYRRTFLIENHIKFPEGVRRMQDMVMNIKAFCCVSKIVFCGKAIYYYRITRESACRKYTPNFGNTAKVILACIQGTVRDNPSMEIQRLYRFKELFLLIETIALYYGHPECELPWKGKYEGIRNLCEESDNRIALSDYQNWMFTKKQRIILGLLSHRYYGVVSSIYTLRNLQNKVKYKELKRKRSRNAKQKYW